MAPPATAGGELAFIDGAQQVEAWLTITAGDDPEAQPGAAFAAAAGAVLTGPGRMAEIVGVRVRRAIVTVGDRRLYLPPVGGFAWEARAGAASEATGVARRVGEFRQQMELALAERLAGPDRLVVLDGRLSFVRDVGGPVVGAIKSHHRMYLPPAEARAVVALRRRGAHAAVRHRGGSPLLVPAAARGRQRRLGGHPARGGAALAGGPRRGAWRTAPRPSCRGSPAAPTATRARRRTSPRSPGWNGACATGWAIAAWRCAPCGAAALAARHRRRRPRRWWPWPTSTRRRVAA